MKKYIISFLCAVSLFVFAGCMEIIPSSGEQISKINKFTIEPNGAVIFNNGSFTVTMDVNIGYDMYIYMQDVSSLRTFAVYHTDKEKGYERTFDVTFSSSGSMGVSNVLKSDSKNWGLNGQNYVPVTLGVEYIIYAKVCDFQIVAGNGNCATSAGYKLSFLNL